MRRIKLNMNQKQLFKVIQNTYVYIIYTTKTHYKKRCAFEACLAYIILIKIFLINLIKAPFSKHLEKKLSTANIHRYKRFNRSCQI